MHCDKTAIQSPLVQPDLCTTCGLPSVAPKLDPPFSDRPFDFSGAAFEKAERVIAEGEGQIHLLEQGIKRLRALQDEKRRVVSQCRSFIAPINRLPDELLALIFEKLYSESRAEREEEWGDDNVCGLDNAPWEMTVVCRRWHNLVLSLPHLWADVQMHLINFHSITSHIQLSQCKTWLTKLRRSESYPLELLADLTISVKPESPMPYWAQQIADICHQLLGKSNLCRSLELRGAMPDGWALDEFTFPHFASLQTLRLADETWIKFLRNSLPLNAPSLTELSLRSFRNVTTSLLSTWSSLRSLYLNNCAVSAAELFHVLYLTSPGLSTLSLFLLQMTYPPSQNWEPTLPLLIFPKLRHAQFSFYDNPDQVAIDTNLLLHIHAPNIAKFQLDYPDEMEYLFARRFLRPPNSAVAPVKQLQLAKPLICEELFLLLSDLQGLEHLIMDFDEELEPFPLLDALCWKDGSTTLPPDSPHDIQEDSNHLCPNLTSVQVNFPGYSDHNPVVVSQLLESFVRSRARVSADDTRDEPPRFLEFVRIAGDTIDEQFLVDMELDGVIRRGDSSEWPWSTED